MPDLYEILDPRPVANSAKYTYFLPAPGRIEAIGNGDLVKITMQAIPASEKWDAERVWLRVFSASPSWLDCTLESEPFDIPGVAKGTTVRVPRTHVLDVIFEDPEVEAAFPIKPRREYWQRCLVDQAVLNGEIPVHYVWREKPDLGKCDDQYPDSGWRIRGDMRNISEAELREREVAYVALGAVLNRDDSWIELIDEPEGVAYEKDFDRGEFVRLPE